MKRQSISGVVVQSNLRRLFLSCTVALVLLAFVRPGLAQNAAEGKTAEVSKDSIVATASSGLEANLGASELSSPQFLGTCPFVKCWLNCDNGLGHAQYFTNVLACYSYSDELGCHASGFFVCSDRPDDAAC
ncbi:MAG TPA: hypothetical protein VIC28_12695 [Thermoanaerobaculia bacterium]|jgi:hypothetical protein